MKEEKLKEVKARLNFERCSGKNSKIQEVSQHSESRTLDARDLRRKLRSRRSHSVSGSLERNPSVFSKIRRDRSESAKHMLEGRRDGGVFNRLGGVDTGSKGRRRQSQVLKKMNSPNHGYAKRQIPSHLERITKKRTKNEAKTTNQAWNGKDCERQSQIEVENYKIAKLAIPQLPKHDSTARIASKETQDK
ncbi:hypothetical protein Tco_0850286 [Tanacetum coccineum]